MGIITSQQFIKEAYNVLTKIIKVDPFSIWIGQLQRPNSALKRGSDRKTQCKVALKQLYTQRNANTISQSSINFTQHAINSVACYAVLFDTVTASSMKLRKHDSMLCEVALN